VTLATPTSETFVRGHVGTIPGNTPAKCEVVSSGVMVLQHLTPKNLRDHVTLDTPTYRKLLSGVMSELSLGTRLPNLKFISSAVLELSAFNAQKITGSRDRDHAHILETFVRCHVETIPGNTPAKFEVRIFSHFGAISI